MDKLPIKYHFNLTEKPENYDYWKKTIVKNNNFLGSLLMPPPNITGNLHLGHGLNLILQDFLERYFYLKGKPVCWISGVDHAGIATQKKVESLKSPHLQTIEQKKNYTLNIWYPQAREKFFQQWEKLGLLVDYGKTKFTLDPVIQEQVKQAFVQLCSDGLIYRDKKLINWDPQLKSAISDIEVEHKSSESKLYYLKYPLLDSNDEYLIVATSRPETIFADVALFVNPHDQKYQGYIGQKIQHPITQKIIPILADEKIIVDFGTGVLKCTPGHDFFDYELGKKYDLPLISCYDEKGVLNDLAGKWQGQEPQSIRQELVKELQEKNICLKIETYQTNLAVSQRTSAPVEPLLSTQWFLDLPQLIQKIEAKNPDFLSQINFHPSRFQQVIKEWKEKIHEWCISRQLWWGHQIPAWYHKKTGEVFVGEELDKCFCVNAYKKGVLFMNTNALY